MNEPNIYIKVTLPDRRLEIMTAEKGERVFLGNLTDMSGHDLTGVRKIIDEAVIPLAKRVEELEKQIHDLENPPVGLDAAVSASGMLRDLRDLPDETLVFFPGGEADNLTLQEFRATLRRALVDSPKAIVARQVPGSPFVMPITGFVESPDRSMILLTVGSPW